MRRDEYYNYKRFPENDIEGSKEKEKSRGEKLLDEQLKQTQELIKSKGISFVNEDCRLDLEEYKKNNVYKRWKIQNDERRIEGYKRKYEEEKRGMSGRELKLKEDGERFEKLKTIIFNKFLGDDFVTVRTSMIDDVDKGIDNIIINKKEGKIVGALDETCSYGEPTEKKSDINEKMVHYGGSQLRYGLECQELGKYDKGKIIASREGDNLPLFYLQIDHDLLDKALDGLNSGDINEKTEAEKEVFERLLAGMYRQSDKWIKTSSIDKRLKGGFSFIHKTIKKMVNDPMALLRKYPENPDKQ